MTPMTRVPASTAREILRLRFRTGLSLRELARRCEVGVATAHATLQRAGAAGIDPSLADFLDDAELARRLYAPGAPREGAAGKPRPDFAEVARARHAGKALLDCWREYRATHPGEDGYSYSHFCQLLKSWQRREADATLPPGDGPGRCRQPARPSRVRHDEGVVLSRF